MLIDSESEWKQSVNPDRGSGGSGHCEVCVEVMSQQNGSAAVSASVRRETS